MGNGRPSKWYRQQIPGRASAWYIAQFEDEQQAERIFAMLKGRVQAASVKLTE